MTLAVVRDLRPQRRPPSPEEPTDFEAAGRAEQAETAEQTVSAATARTASAIDERDAVRRDLADPQARLAASEVRIAGLGDELQTARTTVIQLRGELEAARTAAAAEATTHAERKRAGRAEAQLRPEPPAGR